MTTILEAHTPTGTRRCDAVCHEAKGSKCNCICGGRFHGVGTERAEQAAPEQLDIVRREMDLAPGETVQLRIGA